MGRRFSKTLVLFVVLGFHSLTLAGHATIAVIGGSEEKDQILREATVGIFAGENFDSGFFTGTYIGKNKILTCAHCAGKIQKNLSKASVRFVRPDKSIVNCRVTKSIPKPEFQYGSDVVWWEDVGVLSIDCTTFDLAKVKPVSLAKENINISLEKLDIFGYGSDEMGSGFPAPPTFPVLKATNSPC